MIRKLGNVLGSIREEDKNRTLQEIDLIRRNTAVLAAIGFVTLITLLGWLMNGDRSAAVTGALVSIILLVLLLGFCLYRRILLPYLGYLAVLGSGAIVILQVSMNPSLDHIPATFYLLFLAAIYSNFIINSIAILIGFSVLLYLLFGPAGAAISQTTSMTYIVYYVIIAGLMMALRFVVKTLAQDMYRAMDQSSQLQQQQESRNETIVGLVDQVSQNLGSITAISDETNRSFHEMHTSFNEITNSASAQLDSTLSINQAMQNMHDLVQRMTESFEILNARVTETNAISSSGVQVTEELDATIAEFKQDIYDMASDVQTLKKQMEGTTQISISILEIANQTNLLALNASIEAARAGEHGQGFAVVASEIRKLADLSGHSAEQISKQIVSFSKQIEEASQRMAAILERMDSSSQAAQQTIQAFGSIRESVELLQHLTDGYMEHIAKINEASRSVEEATQHLAATSEEATATMEELTAMTHTLLEQNEQTLQQLKEAEANLKQILAS